jgi:hypothetical protein
VQFAVRAPIQGPVMMMNYHIDPELVQLRHEREVIQSAGRQAIATFLEDQTCFSIIRPSSKVVVFDTRIPIQLAFYALVEHGEYSCH